MRIVSAIAAITVALSSPVSAGEGGGSHYIPGAVGDFGHALVGPSGTYMRNDVFYLKGDLDVAALGDRIHASVSQDILVNNFKLIHLPDQTILGGQPGLVLSLPFVIDASVSGKLTPGRISRDGSRSGLGDAVATGFLNWTHGETLHSRAGINIYLPTGGYDSDRIINTGRNYWSFDPFLAMTYLNPSNGREFSATAGVMFNTENTASDYRTGTEFHIDATLAQHFSASTGLGLTGYYYKQIADDEGALVDRIDRLGIGSGTGFRGEAAGVGLAFKHTVTLGNRDVTFIAKHLRDVTATNRPEGSQTFFSVVTKF